jgi:hypothetical protein
MLRVRKKYQGLQFGTLFAKIAQVQWALRFFHIVALVHKTPYVELYQYYHRTL